MSGYLGKQVGPTGRKRDTFSIAARNRANRVQKEYLAYGQEGVKQAKRSAHSSFPHRWVKFQVTNETRERHPRVSKKTRATFEGALQKAYEARTKRAAGGR